MSTQNKLVVLLQEDMEIMDKATKVLSDSYLRCKNLLSNESFNIEEEEKLEALASRFSRLSDILIQKIWRSLFLVELEEDGTVLDRINKAEKKELIENAQKFRTLRELRNEIVHNYRLDDIRQLYRKILVRTPELLDAVKRLHQYIIKKNLLKNTEQ